MDINTIISAFVPLGKILAILAAFVFLGVLLDYLTGTIAARMNHEWTSSKAREGIWHKVGIFICIIVATLLDTLIILATETAISLPFNYSGFFAPLIEIMFIVTEFCSILENLGKMGVPIPALLIKGIAAFKTAVDEKASGVIHDEPHAGDYYIDYPEEAADTDSTVTCGDEDPAAPDDEPTEEDE